MGDYDYYGSGSGFTGDFYDYYDLVQDSLDLETMTTIRIWIHRIWIRYFYDYYGSGLTGFGSGDYDYYGSGSGFTGFGSGDFYGYYGSGFTGFGSGDYDYYGSGFGSGDYDYTTFTK